MTSAKGGVVLALLLTALALAAYKAGKLETLRQAINGKLVVNR